MKTVCIASQKGGVGKSAISQCLQAWLAGKGRSCLLVDADPQTSTSITVTDTDEPYSPDILDVIQGKALVESAIVHTGDGFLLPGSRNLANGKPTRGDTFRKYIVDPIKNRFDFCIFDTPPELGALLINSLMASDFVLIPLRPDRYSLDALRQLIDTITAVQVKSPNLHALGVIVNLFSPRTTIHRLVLDEISKYTADVGIKLYQPCIRTSVKMQEAQFLGNIFNTAPKAPITADLDALFTAIMSDII